ncbi:hypothetical protein BOTBODRAFT_509454 [Botryobasidium botryosum FD-172 SS1]|uniref:Uncharacterized protein n=1 Tax=Botryobasidium botryosum (strain FD-172 SS1) TaxID=930990 RepID=A0A067N3K3_BOTB1|nr:hypothetical protein BOTBODRAFT_509454 [Botryobasidium botryosum FD-172 SS1]
MQPSAGPHRVPAVRGQARAPAPRRLRLPHRNHVQHVHLYVGSEFRTHTSVQSADDLRAHRRAAAGRALALVYYAAQIAGVSAFPARRRWWIWRRTPLDDDTRTTPESRPPRTVYRIGALRASSITLVVGGGSSRMVCIY